MNADGHIEPDIMAGLLSVGDDTIQSVQSTRAYLSNESEWNSGMYSVSLFDIDADNTDAVSYTHLASWIKTPRFKSWHKCGKRIETSCYLSLIHI